MNKLDLMAGTVALEGCGQHNVPEVIIPEKEDYANSYCAKAGQVLKLLYAWGVIYINW